MNGEGEVHVIQLTPAPDHWPSRACYCRPEEIEINAPCGHLVVVLAHAPLTQEQRELIVSDVRGYFRRGFHS